MKYFKMHMLRGCRKAVVVQDLLHIVNLPIAYNYLVYSRQSCCCEQLCMVKGFVIMWSILLYCFNEQLFCCEWSCLDVVHFIVKNNFVCSDVE